MKDKERGEISTVEEILDEMRNGRLVVLVDDLDANSEGNLVFPAQYVTAGVVNFMATHARGLICLAITQQRADQLQLPLMAPEGEFRTERAFTVSIEAKEGTTTGISTADRARTILVGADPACGPETIVSPGHVFPVVGHVGGVISRAGQIEAAIDLARIAGLNASSVVCRILDAAGSTARLEELNEFCRVHDLKMGSVRDIIAYRCRNDRNLTRVSEGPFESKIGGSWRAIAYRDKAAGTETIALVKGKILPGQPTLVRLHQLSIFADALAEDSERNGLLHDSMRMINEAGSGVIVLINRPTPRFISTLVQGLSVGLPEHDQPIRDYGAGAQILSDLGVEKMILLTNRQRSFVALSGYGLTLTERRKIESS